MPRKRKAARAYRSINQSVEDIVRAKFANPLSWIFLDAETFVRDLPAPAEREAFRKLFPQEFYDDVAECQTSIFDQYPVSVIVVADAAVFRRPQFGQFIKENPPTVALEIPDVRHVPFLEKHVVLARARSEWWLRNGWPITSREAIWTSRHGTDDAQELLADHRARIPDIEVAPERFTWESARAARAARRSKVAQINRKMEAL